MSLIGKIKRSYHAFLMASANVGKNTFNNTGDSLLSDVSPEVKVQYTAFEAMLNGVVTQEVEQLRTEYYLVNDKASNISIKANYDSNGDPILDEKGVIKYTVNNKHTFLQLRKIKTDGSDDQYPLIAQIMNTPTIEAIDYTRLDTRSYKFETTDYQSPHIWKLENYAYKVLIRELDGENVILEFYFPETEWDIRERSKYNTFIKQLQRTEDKNMNSFIGFDEFGFVSDDTDIGVGVERVFLFEDSKFHRRVKFNQYEIIKFTAKKTVFDQSSGLLLMDDQTVQKFENKEVRNGKSNIGL